MGHIFEVKVTLANVYAPNWDDKFLFRKIFSVLGETMKEFIRGEIISYKVHRSKSEREFSQAISTYCIIRHLKTAKHLLYKEQTTLQAEHNLILSQHITELL